MKRTFLTVIDFSWVGEALCERTLISLVNRALSEEATPMRAEPVPRPNPLLVPRALCRATPLNCTLELRLMWPPPTIADLSPPVERLFNRESCITARCVCMCVRRCMITIGTECKLLRNVMIVCHCDGTVDWYNNENFPPKITAFFMIFSLSLSLSLSLPLSLPNTQPQSIAGGISPSFSVRAGLLLVSGLSLSLVCTEAW